MKIKANMKKEATDFPVLMKIIRVVVPKSIRGIVGVWLISKLSKWWWVVRLYTFLLYGKESVKFRPIGDGNVAYNYKGRDVIAPRNAIPIFVEIFHEEIYDKRFKPDGVVVDIGAFVGMYAVKASFYAKEVIAVEPCPETFEMLKVNCKGLKNIHLAKVALWSESGKAKLYMGTANLGTTPIWGGNSLILERSNYYDKDDYIEVDMTTLDELLGKPVSFIKIDTEGAEVEILKGAEKTLANPGVKLAVAAYHKLANGEPELPYLISFLEERKYKVRTDGDFLYAEN